MPNIATVLKEEITRLARKELRDEITYVRKVLAAHRSEIAELKRRNSDLERAIRRLQKSSDQPASAESESDESNEKLRFSAKGLATQRHRLGLSAADFGLLVGASGQSIYKWEEGTVRPRAKHLSAIAAVRKIGKREADERLTQLKGTQPAS
jgi:DNA-binding transcriptional regulator YiaG